jgi:hypothetical protein
MFSTKSKKLMTSAYKLSLRSGLNVYPKMTIFMARNRTAIQRTMAIGAQQTRSFASGLPDHVKLEMPNLSPTMEKVSLRHF